jgi:hypothetical protein
MLTTSLVVAETTAPPTETPALAEAAKTTEPSEPVAPVVDAAIEHPKVEEAKVAEAKADGKIP